MTDLPVFRRDVLNKAFNGDVALISAFEQLVRYVTEAADDARAGAQAASVIASASVLALGAFEGLAAARILTAGDGVAFTDADGLLTIDLSDLTPKIEGGFAATFIVTGETNLILPPIGTVATLSDVAAAVSASVISFNSRTGAITLLSADVTGALGFTPVDAAGADARIAAAVGVTVQAYDADLTTWAGITPASGIGTFLAAPSSANLLAALTTKTGTGSAVFSDSPALSGTYTFSAGSGGSMALSTGILSSSATYIFARAASGIRIQDLAAATKGFISFDATYFSILRSDGGTIVRWPLGTGHGEWFGNFKAGAAQSLASWTTTGAEFAMIAATLTDTSSAAAATITTRAANSFGRPTFASTNAITVTNAATLYIDNSPSAGSNTTITNAYALWVAAGLSFFGGSVSVTGSVAASTYVKTGTFTVAGLPAAGTAGAGARAQVTDANATTFASVVAGGGANKVPVYSDGTNWLIG